MNKNDIHKVRIDVECDGESALSMMLHRDGTLGRSGSGTLPRDGITCLGGSDGSAFRTLLDSLDEEVFAHAGSYDIEGKEGTPLSYNIGFYGKGDQPLTGFEFLTGTDNRDLGEPVAFFDWFIQQAVALTDDWYKKTLHDQRSIRMSLPEKQG